jgi:hypothetical protein
MKLKQKPNTAKKANTGSTKLPLPIDTQLYLKRKLKTNNTKIGPENTPKPPPIYITCIKNTSSLIQR